MMQAVARILLLIGILLLFEMITINASDRRLKTKADQIIRYIREKLSDDEIYSDEDRKWDNLWEEWNKTKDHKRYETAQDGNIFDERKMKHMLQPRKAGGGSRFSRGGSRSGSRSPSVTQYRNTRTGATVTRPSGWQWSRSRSTFLPISTRFSHRSHSSYSRFTTPATGSLTYYYCTSNTNAFVEIQCSSINGDTQCCEEENSLQPFCCGGDISKDFTRDMNRAVQILARIFYTLTAVLLCIHLFIRYSYS